jgi:type VI secretion system secreted protein VgrG
LRCFKEYCGLRFRIKRGKRTAGLFSRSEEHTMRVLRFGLLVAPIWIVGAYADILGTADSFAVLGGSTVTNTGSSVVYGNLGVSPGSVVTGFPPGVVVAPGVTDSGDAAAAQAEISVAAAYTSLVGLTVVTQDLSGQDLGNLTLPPGVYKFDSSAQLTGTLTLNAEGLANQYWVFQIGSTLTTASASSVDIINGGANEGLFWQVGSSATLGTTTAFEGNILALASITFNTGATIACGRALAQTGAVTMDTNTIDNACPVTTAGNGMSGFVANGTVGLLPVSAPVPEPSTLPLGFCIAGWAFLKIRARVSR